MNFQETMEYLRYNAPDMGRLMQRGDALAKSVWDAYRYAYDHRADIQAQNNLIAIVEDYIRRDLNIEEAKVLMKKYGHKDPEDPLRIPDRGVGNAVHNALRRRH